MKPLAFVCAALTTIVSAAAASAQAPQVTSQSIGESVQGREIHMTIVGPPDAARRILVVGCIHGTERAGEAVVQRLRRAIVPPETALFLIRRANPDGCAAGTRGNARGVDLNRNSPWNWKPLPRGTYYSGPRQLSEPESRAINRLIRRIRPNVSIWYHQHADLVDTSLGDIAPKRLYSQLTGLPLRNFGTRPGSITSWQATSYPSSAPIVVELPAGRLSYRQTRRHAEAVLAIAANAPPSTS